MKMKKIYALASACCFVFHAGSSFAATIIVDNNPNHSADYTTLQEAVDAAEFGDTILVGPSFSGNSYGAVTINKSVHIYGTGYLIAENGYTGNRGTSRVDHVIFEGVQNGSGSSNSSIAGFDIGYISIAGRGFPSHLDNISIQRNRISSINIYNSHSDNILSNILILQNLIMDSISIDGTSVIIRNNIVRSVYCGAGEISMTNNSSFADGYSYSNSSYFLSSCSGEVFDNIGVEYDIDVASPVHIHNNYLNNNLQTLQTQVYKWTGSEDAKYQLRDTSLAKGACLNGADCGAFAGATPYILSGLPPRPRITTLELPASVLKTDATMQVNVSAESRN
jgi:hypothetical protein